MAMSLEELLVKEGFKGRRSKTMPRAFFGPEEISMRLHPQRDQQISGPLSGIKNAGRTKSDITRYNTRGEYPASDKGKKPMDNLIRSYRESKKDMLEKLQSRLSENSGEISECNNEIVEVGVQNRGRYKDIYLNEVYSGGESEGKYMSKNERRGKHRQPLGDNIRADKKFANNSNKSLTGRISFSENYHKSLNHPAISHSGSSKSLQASKIFDGIQSYKRSWIEETVAAPALDEAAVQAIVSIFSEYAKRFIKDEDFRTSLRHNSFASLNFVGLEEGLNSESKVIDNLEQAIETVERAAEECASAKELKRASLQLSVITGLNDLRDGFTSGIPNFKLSACAHLYLSVTYKIQKKDKIAAKHLLQVFCDSPFQARTTLLSDLWDNIFLPHLSHLKVWYNKETDSLTDSPSKARKLKLLEKMYNESLDSGTYQFANYYKGWLTEGVEAPSVPSIQIPSKSELLVQQTGLCSQSSSPIGHFPSQPMVSKKLYDAVFPHSYKSEVEVKDYEEENFVISARSSDGSIVEEKQSFIYNSEKGRHMERAVDPEGESHRSNVIRAEEDQRFQFASSPEEIQVSEKFGNRHQGHPSSESNHFPHIVRHANELILKRLAKAVFESEQTEKSIDDASSYPLPQYEDAPYPESLPTKLGYPFEELQECYIYWNGKPIFPSIPQEYICPLTGLLFEDPVTLETGQTFEWLAVARWLDKGNLTCPVTGKALESQAVPLTNFILKHAIDNWKSEHHRHLLALASQVDRGSLEKIKSKDQIAVFILEQLLVTSSQEERAEYVKQLISLGGLQFLIKRFHSKNMEERTCVSVLLFSCIEVDTGCRNHVARSIDKLCLLELLHSEPLKSRSNSVMLLTELICQNRRKDAIYFINGFQNEEITKAKDVVLVYLQSCPSDQRPLVSVLLLHLCLLVEPQKYTIYIEEAIDAIAIALESSISNEKVREGCCRALLILGARFSSCGKVMTEDWILKQAGFLDGPESDFLDNEEDNFIFDESVTKIEESDEEEATEKWLQNLAAALLGDVKKSFLGTVSKCLTSENLDLVRVCLTTVAWLTSALASLSETELQLSAFSALISPLKEYMENDHLIELKILASMSLFNFNRVPECRASVMKIAKEISIPLGNLAEVTWTAKKLYAIVSDSDQE